ncbi:helix-turn-helix transcriptional regulator [Photobacterium chitinilyticum]|uniref:AlpA family phage regulatory protein n=1 Tax=Photobacterium chitinilyticum TaxID=2485123 RepID=A0A444JLZ0_9GAMM|nr:AlpA family phage regulatory protein [Photobacterium chitinilyticum]RWX54091.1 AlpA family phage regulatory protein [Photobacterium chitinilyticum]
MNNTIQLKIIDKKSVLERFSFSNSTLYLRINAGLMTPPVNLGGRRVGWPEHEVANILDAMVAGKNANYIKKLVAFLIKKRSAAWSDQ